MAEMLQRIPEAIVTIEPAAIGREPGILFIIGLDRQPIIIHQVHHLRRNEGKAT